MASGGPPPGPDGEAWRKAPRLRPPREEEKPDEVHIRGSPLGGNGRGLAPGAGGSGREAGPGGAGGPAGHRPVPPLPPLVCSFAGSGAGDTAALAAKAGRGAGGGSALLALAGGPGWAAPNAAITVDGVSCTLAEAITSANNDNAGGNGCTDGSGADTITLNTDVTLTATDNSTYDPTGLPVVTSAITIEGGGTRSAGGAWPTSASWREATAATSP